MSRLFLIATGCLVATALLVDASSSKHFPAFMPTLKHRRPLLEGTSVKASGVVTAPTCHSAGSTLSMRLNRKPRGRALDSEFGKLHSERIARAGRKGTKRFIDPTKVFVGNLPFECDESHVRAFLVKNLGQDYGIHSIKLVRDWKTGKSKGYAFVIFNNPIIATSAIYFIKNKTINGRIIAVHQGQKKLGRNKLYIKKKKKKPASKEEAVIQEGLNEAMDIEELIKLEEFDETEDDALFEDEEDEESDEDDDFSYDGVYEELYGQKFEDLTEEEQKLNRQQRREILMRRKRRKLPHKGFEMP